jgi:hypothetical protein
MQALECYYYTNLFPYFKVVLQYSSEENEENYRKP